MHVHHSALASFVLQALLIIVSARLVGWVARQLGQPVVIAEVTAGILLGPSLFGNIAPEAFQALFPASSLPMLGLMSQAGLLFFMFLIGLELDPKHLRGLGGAALGISATGIILPFGMGLLLANSLFDRLANPSTSKAAFALFMGVAMSITAFPVLARILAERKLVRTKMGSLALACAAVDDVTAWCLLAFAVSVAHSGNISGAVVTTLLALVYVGVMFVVVRPILNRVAARVTTRAGLTQNLVAITFILILLSGLLTELIGIHALFGGFVLGAIMPRDSGYVQALAERLEDFIVVFMLPLFFAFSGLRTQIGLLHGVDDWLLCSYIILLACAGKFGGGFIAARITGMGLRDASALGVLMNTRGLMELVVLNVGLDLGVITAKAFTMLVIMALVTTVITTPLLALFYPSAARAVETTPSKPVLDSTLLLCVADARSGPGMAILASAMDAGQRKHRIIALHLERPPERTSNYVSRDHILTPREQGLAQLLATAATLPIMIEPISFISSDPSADICRVAQESHAAWVLLGLHRPTVSQQVFGGTVYDVLDDSTANVAMVIDRGLGSLSRPSTPTEAASLPELRHILVAYHGEPEDDAALSFAAQFLGTPNSQMTLLLIDVPGSAHSRTHTAHVEELRQKYADKLELKPIAADDSVDAVLTEANSYDLVVLGFSNRWGFAHRRLGLQPNRLIVECPTSLVIVHRAKHGEATS